MRRFGGSYDPRTGLPAGMDRGGHCARDYYGLATITIARLHGVSNLFPIKRIIFPGFRAEGAHGGKEKGRRLFEEPTA